ncbi:calcium homeostasis modulator protein 6 [Amia ocellicauda]|uniref:calcium homeostasis modulator protein 6 n=1 Tax=Amia ocellicauda TaxID=2972642 RepID=UPI0034642FCA|nr:CAHM5 protein [Amia calva]
MDKFGTVFSVFQKQQTSLGFGLVALLTAGGEQIFSAVVFKCPCSSWSFAYGSVFLLVPALVLLMLGYMLSDRTWKLFTGVCIDDNSVCRKGKLCACFKVFALISVKAMVAPISWIAVALLNGSYFECAMTGLNSTLYTAAVCEGKPRACEEELQRVPCGKSSMSSSDSQDVLLIIKAQSQTLGWVVIASIMVSGLVLTCMARCRSPVSYLQLRFWRAYTQSENDLFEKMSSEHARKLAERNLTSFFQLRQPAPMETPDAKAWKKISSLYKFGNTDHYYSNLHKYVETHSDHARLSVKSEEGDFVNPSVLAFVDDGKSVF